MTTDKPNCRAAQAHLFDQVNPMAERSTRLVVLLTVVMMVVELLSGWRFHSMALVADGWHMSSHAIALGLTALAYALARRLSRDERFSFGTWKIEVLGGYTSAIFLVLVAAYMLIESADRLLHPVAIVFNDAILVAVLGLLVNLCSAWLLGGAAHGHDHGDRDPSHAHADDHDHAHAHAHAHDHDHDHAHADDQAAQAHTDLNLRSAYVHVAADAATSLLAIAALAGGRYLGAGWLDPAVGLIGAVVVGAWAVSLLRQTARALLDAEMDAPVVGRVRALIDRAGVGADIEDLHVWRVGKRKYACVISLGTDAQVSSQQIRAVLAGCGELAHVTVEINPR